MYYICICVCVPEEDSLELKLRVSVSYLTWVLGTCSGPLQEQLSLLTAKPPSKPILFYFVGVSLYGVWCICGCTCVGMCVEARNWHRMSFFHNLCLLRLSLSLNSKLANLAKLGSQSVCLSDPWLYLLYTSKLPYSLIIVYFYVYECLPIYMYMDLMLACYLHRSEEAIRSWDWSYGSCEPPCGCWNLNPGPLQEQVLNLSRDSSSPSGVYVVLELWTPVFTLSHLYSSST